MPITTMQQLITALPGRHIHLYKASGSPRGAGTWFSFWRQAGFPPAAAVPPTGDGEVPTRLTTGAVPFSNAATGNALYLARFSVAMSQLNYLIVYDRLWHNSGFNANITTPQTITNPPTITRPDSSGNGVELWGEVYAATGSTASTFSVIYTNSAGVTDRVATYSKPAAALVVGEMFPFALDIGDTGVRTVHSVQLSAATGTAGNFGLVLLRRVAEIPIAAQNVIHDRDAISLCLPLIYNDACLAFMVLALFTSSGGIWGGIDIVEG